MAAFGIKWFSGWFSGWIGHPEMPGGMGKTGGETKGRRRQHAQQALIETRPAGMVHPPGPVGRSQAVRQRILIPPCGGSNPPAPAKVSN